MFPGSREMPSHRDGGDAQQGRDRLNGEAFEFVHDQHRPAARWKTIQRPTDRHPCHQFGLVIRMRVRMDIVVRGLEALAHGGSAPLIAPEVHEHPHEPRCFVSGTMGRSSGAQHEAVLAAPAGAIAGRLRMTEQGENIHMKYGLRAIAATFAPWAR